MSQLRRHGCGSAIVDLFRFHWFRFGVRTRALWSLRRTGTRLLQHELASVETRRGHHEAGCGFLPRDSGCCVTQGFTFPL